MSLSATAALELAVKCNIWWLSCRHLLPPTFSICLYNKAIVKGEIERIQGDDMRKKKQKKKNQDWVQKAIQRLTELFPRLGSVNQSETAGKYIRHQQIFCTSSGILTVTEVMPLLQAWKGIAKDLEATRGKHSITRISASPKCELLIQRSYSYDPSHRSD